MCTVNIFSLVVINLCVVLFLSLHLIMSSASLDKLQMSIYNQQHDGAERWCERKKEGEIQWRKRVYVVRERPTVESSHTTVLTAL